MNISQIYDSTDTICAISTAPGVGAIAVARISGTETLAICDKIWQGKSLSQAASHTAHLGNIIDPETGEILDQAVATVFRAPGTFTGEDIVEFGIHGSRWIQRRLISLLNRCGARLAHPGEFTRRAFASGKMDLAEAEAVADVIASSSAAAHRLAINQMRGNYSRRLEALRAELLDLASLLELELDFSEEDVEFASRERLLTLADSLNAELTRLADSFDAGTAIKDGIPVAIIGRTNAGKSSLLNALLGDERAIVSDIHGTTRDIVEDTIEMGPYLIRFKDTAGLRSTTDTIENLGIERSRAAARTAGIVLYVIDPTQDNDANAIATELEGIESGRIIYIINKNDITEGSNIALPSKAVHISALTGDGIDNLRNTIIATAAAITDNASEADIVVTNARHAAAFRAAATAAQAVSNGLRTDLAPDFIAQDLRECLHHIASITGEISTPEILASIFSRFCIGK